MGIPIPKPKSIDDVDNLLEKGLITEVETYCYQVCRILDDIHYRLVMRKITNAESVDTYLDKVTGYRGYLNPVLEALEAYKKGEENEAYINEKEAVESKGDKFVSAVADKLASKAVQRPRTLRNKIRGYVNQADKDIGVLQSKLNYYREIERKQLENQG